MMTRSAFGLGLVVLGVTLSTFPGCGSSGVGDPCTPEQEYNVDFNAFDVKQVSVESKSFQCQTRLCLVNHFQGRVSCPYGQDPTGKPLSGSTSCNVPGSTQQVTGTVPPPAGDTTLAAVTPQCTDRIADKAVYCSCRCQNVDGTTNDGAVYCKCPDGFQCSQLVASTGIGNEGLTGGYCIKNGTAYDPNNACGATCDKVAHPCN